MQRAASEVASTEQWLLVKHKVLGPTPPSAEALRAALRDLELRHRVMRVRYMLGRAPLTVVECEDEAEGVEAEDDEQEAAGTAAEPPAVHVVMQPHKFDRACRAVGGRFVIFAPWIEKAGNPPTILAAHVEALPEGV